MPKNNHQSKVEVVDQEPKAGKELEVFGSIMSDQYKVDAARAMTEVHAQIQMAQLYPRDEKKAWQNLMNACSRKSLAEAALYSYPRGGKDIQGRSVQLARAAGQCWGRVRYGFKIIGEDDETMSLRGFAFDLENLSEAVMETTFRKIIQRRIKHSDGSMTTVWVRPDERDLQELQNRIGAKLERNCLFKILPPDLLDDAENKVRETLKSSVEDPKELEKWLILNFEKNYGVTLDMLRAYIGSDAWGRDALVELRGVYNAIKDDVSKKEEYFKAPEKEEKKPPQRKTQAVKEKLKADNKATAEPEAEVEPEKSLDKIDKTEPVELIEAGKVSFLYYMTESVGMTREETDAWVEKKFQFEGVTFIAAKKYLEVKNLLQEHVDALESANESAE